MSAIHYLRGSLDQKPLLPLRFAQINENRDDHYHLQQKSTEYRIECSLGSGLTTLTSHVVRAVGNLIRRIKVILCKSKI